MDNLNENEKKSLQNLTSILNGGKLTQKEFTDAFEQIVTIIFSIETRIIGNNNSALKIIKDTFEILKGMNKNEFESFKKSATATITNAVAGMKDTLDQRMASMEASVNALEDGKDADEESMLQRLQACIPSIDDILKYLPKAGTSIRDALELLNGNERLKLSAIDGAEELLQSIADAQKTGKAIQIRGGGARGFFVFIGGVKKGIIQTLDFVPGTGMAIAYSKVNGRDTITFNATGGAGGITVETPAESPNSVITEFTVTSQPRWVVADGTTYYENAGYTYASLTVTMEVAPSSFIRAIL